MNVALVKADQIRDRASKTASVNSQEADTVVAMWGQSDAALSQAESALKTGAADERTQQRVLVMREQVKQGRAEAERRRAHLQRQEKLLSDLDEARMTLSNWVDNHFDYNAAIAKYAAAFADYGLEVRPGGAEVLVRRIQADRPPCASPYRGSRRVDFGYYQCEGEVGGHCNRSPG